MKEEIRQFIEQELLSGKLETKLATDKDILSTGTIDSIGAMRLVSFIEKRFEMKIPPQDLVIENFVTIDAIQAYISNRLQHDSDVK